MDWAETDDEHLEARSREALSAVLHLLDSIRNDFDPVELAECAVSMLNAIDYDLNMITGVEDPFEDPRMKAELALQEDFLSLLASRSSIDESIKRYGRTDTGKSDPSSQ